MPTSKIVKIEVSNDQEVFLMTDTVYGVTGIAMAPEDTDEEIIEMALDSCRQDLIKLMYRPENCEVMKARATDWRTIYEAQ